MPVGGPTALMRDVDRPAAIGAIGRHRVTHAFFVPTVIHGLLQVPQR